jgi:DNA-binding response OmpR family regulator
LRARVLVIDQGCSEGTSVRSELLRCGFEVTVSPDADEALRRLSGRAVDASVVFGSDAGAPGVCKLLAGLSHSPILAVVDASQQQQAIPLLEAGADRVIAWPCSRRELEARVLAGLRTSAAAKRNLRVRRAVAVEGS